MNQNSRRQFLGLVALLAISATILLTNLGTARLWDRDEPRNAGCAAEMLSRGDWIVPMFNDELRHQKPVLLYWLMISAYQVLGTTEFAARIWSALLAIGTVGLTYGIGRRLLGARVGLLAGFVLTTSMMFVVAGRAATPDSVLIFCSTLAIWMYVMGTFVPAPPQADQPEDRDPGAAFPRLRNEGSWFPESWYWIAGMYAAMGLGVLAKGLAGCILPTAIIGMFLLIQRLRPLHQATIEKHSPLAIIALNAARTFSPWHFLKTCWSMRPITALAIILAIAAPWYVLVGLRTEGDFLREFLIGEHFGRATQSMENHGGGLWYYPLALMLGMFPWSIFAVPLAIQIDRTFARKENVAPALVFCMCWAFVQIGIFSVAKTKLPSYITPCYPGIAILLGFFLHRVASSRQLVNDWWIRGSFATYAIVGIVVAGGMLYISREYLPGEYRLLLLAAIPLAGGLAGLVLFWSKRNLWAVRASCAAAVLFVLLFFGWGTVWVSGHRHSQQMMVDLAREFPSSNVATYRCLESSWIFYAQRSFIELLPTQTTGQSTELQNANKRTRFWHDQPDLPLQQYLAEHQGGLIITRSSRYQEIAAELPDHYAILRREPFFLQRDELVLIGPQQAQVANAESINSEAMR